ncbi:MAG TPA: TonB-dependent receptor [Pyrinomonadaceae bacterium]|jgi:hypothetical protein
MKLIRQSISLCLLAAALLIAANAQQTANGTIRGKVVDVQGALIGGASVTVVGANGAERTTQTNQEGLYSITNLAAGRYTVRISAQGFSLFENAEIDVASGKTLVLDATLSITVNEEVTVGGEQPINTSPDANASAIVLNQEDIQSLPDDPAELEAALQALAGPGAGPSGGEIFIDGFSGGRLPPRDSIREIRVNQNPFSSEYDRLGLGRIEIFTKPGTDKWRGEIGSEFEDESFNSRNPFATNRPSFQLRNINGNAGGPLVKKRASFFVDFEKEDVDNNALINALILDPALNTTSFQQSVLAPQKNFEISPRLDFQVNQNNTLTARYFFEGSDTTNAGLGGFDLPSRAFASSDSEHTLRVTDTAVISPSIINEARFQFIRRRATQTSTDNSPTIRVLDAFTGGGANIGSAFANEDRLEVQNFTSFIFKKHSLKIGGRLRQVHITDASPGNFAGTFTFTNLEQYRNTILDVAGARPTQFTIAGGNPQASVKRTDLGIFAQDDWRVNPALTLSFGLRYETQTNVSSDFNFAPRFAFAYAPGANGSNKPKTVFRGGFGIFYDRFSEGLTLQSLRFNGINQQQFVVTDPAILDQIVFSPNGSVTNVPSIQTLAAFAQPQTTRVVAPNLQTPYTNQIALSVERQLPFKTTLSATYVFAQTRRLLRSRNINAPVNGVRPAPSAGNIFQYESTGRFNQNQLIINFRSNFSEHVSIFGNYAFGGAKSDSDGAGTFPANQYDLSGEYGNALVDIRHRFVVGGNVTVPFGIRLSPFITFRSGVPFNITNGTDTNGDTIFNDRPAFATSLSEPGIIVTRFGAFDPTPDAGDTIIPRNYGRGPSFFVVNLRAAKEFGFGGGSKKKATKQVQVGDNNNRTGTNSPFGGGGAQRGGGGGDDDESPYKLEFSVQIRNLFNRTNGGTPVGNLRSPFFGEPVSLASGFGFGGGGQSGGNRRVRFEVQFSF